MAYRPDIDGLRAIAVLLVLFNHVGFPWFSGGFIGVDVFFVISGYLICSLILKGIDENRFSLAGFYERRIRRIAPAFLVVLLATSALSYQYLFPSELKSFAQTELGALFSVSNVVLLNQTSYFDPIGKLKPLLHTWSLGVEEQFYIVFPILMLALVRWGHRRLKWILWSLTVVSFLLMEYWMRRSSDTAFFLAPFRAWEFLLGILLAVQSGPALDCAWKRNLASAFGLLLILWTGVRYYPGTPYPGWHALPPCVGAVFVIAAGESGTSAVSQLLAWTPIRWIGLISYSLYLWHWPFQVFQTTNNILVPERFPAWVAKIAVIAASLVAAALSWRFVEQPFRTGRFRSSRRVLYAATGSLFALLLWFSAELVYHGGWPPPSVPRSAAYYDFARAAPSVEQLRWNSCYFDPDNFTAGFSPAFCLKDDPTRKQFLLLGDSHAAHSYWGFRTASPDVNISEIAVNGCAPTITHPPWKDGVCDRFSDFIFKDYLLHHHVDTVLLVGRWVDWDVDHLQQTTDWIKQHGMKVVVFGPSIEFDAPLVRLIELAHREHDPHLLARHRVQAPEQMDRRMQTLARDQWHVPYISMYEDLCNRQSLGTAEDASGCPVYGAPSVPLLWDTDHLSPTGGTLFARTVRARNQLP
jgi:peptidoglycan/LPS O-acetylase OafA/YrhL